MNNYSDTYNTFYQSNAASIFCYKSSRKNSKCSDIININHLINRETDRRVSDNRIMDQIAGTIEKIVYYCKQYKHIELSCYMDVFKQIEYENANNEIYHGVEDQRYCFQRVIFSSIEQCINFVFSVYCLGIWENIQLDGQYNTFEQLYNACMYYNCTPETGRYIAFYVK